MPELGEGRFTRLTVSDDGHGMDERTAAQAFDPYFTTKGPDVGTGLGLSIVHSIVRNCGGAMTLSSELDVGSTLRLYFPAADHPATPDRYPSRKAPPGRGQRILYLDDEDMLIRLGARILANLGYEAVTFTDPAEALAAFRARPQEHDALVTDLNMPNMTGIDVAREALALRPELPVLILSGFIDADHRAQAAALGVRDLILKPTTPEVLRGALAALFEASDAAAPPRRS